MLESVLDGEISENASGKSLQELAKKQREKFAALLLETWSALVKARLIPECLDGRNNPRLVVSTRGHSGDIGVANDALAIEEEAARLVYRTENLPAQPEHLVRGALTSHQDGEREPALDLPRDGFLSSGRKRDEHLHNGTRDLIPRSNQVLDVPVADGRDTDRMK